MTIDQLCTRLSSVPNLTNAQKAVAILWFFDASEPGISRSAPELARIISSHGLGNPNPTALGKMVRGTHCVLSASGMFRVRQDKKAEVRSWIESVLTGFAEEVPLDAQFLSEQVWTPTRPYIERVCRQLNGAYHSGFYDCAAVMIRRVIETLIIEAYEKQQRQSEITQNDGNFHMLGKLVEAANGASGLSLGREARKGLEEIKKLGDRSAHNRRYNAKASDLDKVRDTFRISFEDLANMAGLYGGKES